MNTESNDELLGLSDGQLLRKLVKDVYFGNGKPALTVRMALQEGEMATVHSNIADIKKGMEKSNTLVIGTLLSSVGGLIMIGVEIYLHSGK